MIYDQDWLERYKDPGYEEEFETKLSSVGTNDSCGDRIKMMIEVEDGKIVKARFVAQGCVMSKASADLLCEEIEGKDFLSCKNQDMQEWLAKFKDLSPGRYNCVLLALKALKEIEWQ